MAPRGLDEIRIPDSVRLRLAAFAALLRQALGDPETVAAARHAQDVAALFRALPEADERAADLLPIVHSAIMDFIQAIADAALELADALGTNGLLDLGLSLVTPAGEPLFPMRLRTVPGYPGRPLWYLSNAGDVERFGAQLRPGQIWVNASELTRDGYRKLRNRINESHALPGGRRHRPSGVAKEPSRSEAVALCSQPRPRDPIWALANRRQAGALGRVAAPGQVWVDASDLTRAQYVGLWGLVSAQQQLGLGQRRRRAGRATGWRSTEREALIAALQAHPDWTDPQLYTAAAARGMRTDAYYAHVERNRRWLHGIRRAAGVPRRKPAP